MSDVAGAAQVSVTTVSHVLNRTRPVAAATEMAVLTAVAETGYVPDDVVRSMRTVGTRTVGLGLSLAAHPQLSELIRALHGSLAEAGYSLLLSDTRDESGPELRAVNDLVSRNVDALLLAPSAHPDLALEYCARRQVPVVLVDRLHPVELDQVGAECVDATAQLVGHLAEHGHERIALVSGLAGLSTTTQRADGYRLGLARAGLPVDEQYLVDGGSTQDGAREALRRLLALPQPPTAVVSGNNEMTLGLMAQAKASGLGVPRDLALVGYDDFPWADSFDPRLTVMAQPIRAIGEQAVTLLLERLENPRLPARTVSLRPTFVHRDSCGCALPDA